MATQDKEEVAELKNQVSYLSALLEETAKTTSGILVENSRLKLEIQILQSRLNNKEKAE